MSSPLSTFSFLNHIRFIIASKKVGFILAAMFCLLMISTVASAQVSVTATAGTVGPTPYTTLKLAFDAINAGTHQGAITIDIQANTTEGTTPATLNSSGAGSASYTSVLIRPTADGVSISGNPVTGFGVIQLNGADNVTIDGDNPNTGGTNRNLTVSNTTTTTVIANSAIRIATSAAVTSADNNTIKNCALLGNVTAGNASTITSTTGSSNSSFGIYIGGNGGATATGAPTAITSVTTNTAPTGTTINNLLIDNNTVSQCARAIVFNGAAASVSNGVTISNNIVGDQGAATPATPPYTAPATTVYTKGIWVAGTASITVSGNTLKNIMSYVGTTITSIELLSPVTNSTISNNTSTNIANNGTSSIVKAILVSSTTGAYSIAGNSVTNVQALANASGTDGIEVTAGSTAGTIERNKIQTVYNRGNNTFGAYGLNLTSGTGIVIKNNFISDINMDMTGGAAFSTQFSVHGIRITGGTNHKVYHNSVQLFGSLLGTATTTIMTSCFTPSAATITGMDVRNNIFSNTMTGGTTSIAHVSIFLPASATSSFNLTLNNNDYFSGPDAAAQGIAHVGTTYTSPPAGPTTYAGLYTAVNFNPADTTSTTNLRTYTNTLSTAATNDNASKVVDPQFVSTTDLHIAVASPMVDMGASVGVTIDIDNQVRVGTPDIGADEPSGVSPPANDIAATAVITPAPNSGFVSGTSVSPQASFTNVGTATQTSVMVQFTITGPGGFSYSNTQTIATINPSQTLTVTFAATPTFTTAGTYTSTATVLTADANPANDTTNATFTVFNSFSGGSVNVGTGQTYTSLTNPAGIFDAVNAGTVTSNITINITSDLSGETGAVALNEFASGFTLTIKPSGAARTISGASTVGNTALIKLSGADGVTIDGSLSGGTDRSLTITNTNAAGVVIWIATNATSGANNNTVKNSNLFGNSTPFTTIAGILSGSGTTFGSAAEFQQSNNTIQNNLINRVQNCLFLSGNTGGLDQNWVVTGNNFGSAVVSEKMGFRGMLISGAQNMNVSNNIISGISSSTGTTSTMSGIQVAGNISGGSVTRNQIKDIRQNNTAGWGSNGIYLATTTTASNLTIANNFISDVASQGFADVTSVDNGYGIMIDTGGGFKLYHNTVNMNTNQVAAGSVTAAINIAAAVTTAGGIDLRNNIFANTETIGTRYAIYDSSTAGATIFSSINYNDYFAQNVGFLTAAQVTLANWQTATGQDANSKAVDPLFVSTTDLHLQAGSPLLAQCVLIAGIDNDVDNDLRDDVPDIGADELVAGRTGTIPAGTYRDANTGTGSLGGNVTITGNLTLSGTLTTGANTLTIGCTGSISGANPTTFVIGNLKKNYCSTGVKGFEVGTANGYSPVSANVTAGTFPADLTVTAVQATHSSVNFATSLKRYWTLTEGGVITANLQFTYLDPTDIAGTEANYRLIRVSAGLPRSFANECPTPTGNNACVAPAANTATINGVTNFSDWTLGEPVAPTAAPATISGRVIRPDGTALGGVTINLGGNASARTITSGDGQYRFENVPTDAFYSVTPGLANYSFSPASRSFALLGNMTDAGFTANADGSPSANAIDTVDYFVRQQYLDFLGREPDMGGWLYWTSQISACGNNPLCIKQKRIDVSAAFFASEEFQQTGSFIYRLYQTGLGRQLSYDEFTTDRSQVLAGPNLADNRIAFANEFVTRPEFASKYQHATTGGAFVDSLLATVMQSTGLDLSAQRDALIAEYNQGADQIQSRSRVLRMLADVSAIKDAAYNPSFVLMQYFGYLRRDIDQGGYAFWLDVLNNGEPNNYRGMVCAFLTSTEYQQRFSTIVTHSNGECGP
jgi:hypothetical protein